MVHEILIRMVACSHCGRRAAMLPDFIVKRRLDSALAIGAALLAPLGVELPAGVSALYVSVPQRTPRLWRQRFAERSEVLTQRFPALTVHWGGHLPFRTARDAASERRAVDAIGLAWQRSQQTTNGRHPAGMASRQRHRRQPAPRHPRGPAVARRRLDDWALTGALNRASDPLIDALAVGGRAVQGPTEQPNNRYDPGSRRRPALPCARR